jgi:hypothetical protein
LVAEVVAVKLPVVLRPLDQQVLQVDQVAVAVKLMVQYLQEVLAKVILE